MNDAVCGTGPYICNSGVLFVTKIYQPKMHWQRFSRLHKQGFSLVVEFSLPSLRKHTAFPFAQRRAMANLVWQTTGRRDYIVKLQCELQLPSTDQALHKDRMCCTAPSSCVVVLHPFVLTVQRETVGAVYTSPIVHTKAHEDNCEATVRLFMLTIPLFFKISSYH